MTLRPSNSIGIRVTYGNDNILTLITGKKCFETLVEEENPTHYGDYWYAPVSFDLLKPMGLSSGGFEYFPGTAGQPATHPSPLWIIRKPAVTT